jgi:hypothetical protein
MPVAWPLSGHATDAAGRPGIAVARKISASTEDSELIFSRSTYRLLGGAADRAIADVLNERSASGCFPWWR